MISATRASKSRSSAMLRFLILRSIASRAAISFFRITVIIIRSWHRTATLSARLPLRISTDKTRDSLPLWLLIQQSLPQSAARSLSVFVPSPPNRQYSLTGQARALVQPNPTSELSRREYLVLQNARRQCADILCLRATCRGCRVRRHYRRPQPSDTARVPDRAARADRRSLPTAHRAR